MYFDFCRSDIFELYFQTGKVCEHQLTWKYIYNLMRFPPVLLNSISSLVHSSEFITCGGHLVFFDRAQPCASDWLANYRSWLDRNVDEPWRLKINSKNTLRPTISAEINLRGPRSRKFVCLGAFRKKLMVVADLKFCNKIVLMGKFVKRIISQKTLNMHLFLAKVTL